MATAILAAVAAAATDAANAAGEHGAAHGAASGTPGLPQLDFTTWPSQIFWLVIALVVLYQLMSKVALPRIGTVIEERADAIADDLDRAEEYRRKAREAEQTYQKALADARRRANEIAGEAREKINARIADAMAEADAEISARTVESGKRIAEIRDSALVSIEEVATETAGNVLDALMPEARDDARIADAVRARIG